jgi:hypothetical protein
MTDVLSGQPSRRGFLGLLGKAGLFTVGLGAALATTEQEAWAGNAACCNLQYPPGSPNYCQINSAGAFVCPGSQQGSAWKTWCCCTGKGTAFQRTYQCAECTFGTSCTSDGIICSAYWTVNANGCTSGCNYAITNFAQADSADLARWKTHPWGLPITATEKQAAGDTALKHTHVHPRTDIH